MHRGFLVLHFPESVLCQGLLTRFRPDTVECALIGCKVFVDKYQGRALDIVHIDKKANTKW